MDLADIISWGTISCLGSTREEIDDAFSLGNTGIHLVGIGSQRIPAAPLSPEAERRLSAFLELYPFLKRHDRTVQLAAFAAQEIVAAGGAPADPGKTLVCIGSSRGATDLTEQRLTEFLTSGQVSPLTSPTTTLGNLSSTVASVIGSTGPVISHSMTCSTFLQSMGNAIAWLNSGLIHEAWAGAAEACLTPFTIAQFQALRLLSRRTEHPFCTPGPEAPASGMVLGEGAVMVRLGRPGSSISPFRISGIGFAGEASPSMTGTSSDGDALYHAMEQCLSMSQTVPDIILAHMPGTRQGDQAEWEAIRRAFPQQVPAIIPIKWMTGHWLGASAGSSLLAALHLLQGKSLPRIPFHTGLPEFTQDRPSTVMINALGFGGQAASLQILCKG